MEKGYFYFISDEFYHKFHQEKLMRNKEKIGGETHDRPCYYAFQDETNEQVFWMIPVSSQTDKYEREYRKAIDRYRMCDTISFGYLKGEYSAFLLQNMFPITYYYLLNQYFYSDTQIPVQIPNDLKRELNAKARKIIRLAEKGKRLTFPHILDMKKVLEDELRDGK